MRLVVSIIIIGMLLIFIPIVTVSENSPKVTFPMFIISSLSSVLESSEYVTYEPIQTVTYTPGFIGYSNVSFEWEFELEQEDVDIYTEVEVINETVLEITVNAKHELNGNYKWDMAICNISGIKSLKYMEEDAQGGFEYSDLEDLNYIKLEYEGLPSNWCEETDGYGFVLFSSGSKNQLPEHFRIIFPEGEKEFKMFTGSGTEVLIGISASAGMFGGYNEKIIKDSNEDFHLLLRDVDSDIQYANSSDDGVTWTTNDLKDAQTANYINLLINSTDGLWAIWADTSASDIYYSTSSDYGVTWSTPAIILGFDGNLTHKFDDVSAVMDDNDNIHICVITSEWDDDSNNDWLVYFNYSSSSGWLENLEWVNQDATDDTDSCDIETDSNGVVYIVGYGGDDDCIDLWTSTGTGWGGENRIEIHTSDTDSFPGIFIDKNDKIVVVFETGSSDLGFANSTSVLATTTWTVNAALDTDDSDYPYDIKITDYGDIYIIYYSSTDDIIYSALWNSTDDSWSIRNALKTVITGSAYPSMRGSRIGSDTITNRIDYMYFNTTLNEIYFDWFEVTAPPLIPDETPPIFSNNATNSTLAGKPVNFTIDVTDNENLDNTAGYIFSTNNTGTWMNSSFSYFTESGTTLTAWNQTIINSTVGLEVQWKFYANDSSTDTEGGNWNVSTIYNLTTTIENVAPTTSNLTEPADPTTYSYGRTYYFNTTICDYDGLDDIDQVYFEWNDTTNTSNITTTTAINSTCAVFLTSRVDDPAHTSTPYNWYVNDSLDQGDSDGGTFTVSKRAGIYSTSSSPIQTYRTASSYDASESNQGDSGCVYTADRNGTVLGTGSPLLDRTVLGVAHWQYTYKITTACQNYSTASSSVNIIRIYPADSQVNITLMLDGDATASQSRRWNNITNIQGNETNEVDTGCTYTLEKNGTGVPNGAYALGVGIFNYTWSTNGCLNFTAANLTRILTVDSSCIYHDNNWEVNCTEECIIESDTNIGSNYLIFKESGEVTLNADIAIGELHLSSDCKVVFETGKSVVLNE